MPWKMLEEVRNANEKGKKLRCYNKLSTVDRRQESRSLGR